MSYDESAAAEYKPPPEEVIAGLEYALYESHGQLNDCHAQLVEEKRKNSAQWLKILQLEELLRKYEVREGGSIGGARKKTKRQDKSKHNDKNKGKGNNDCIEIRDSDEEESDGGGSNKNSSSSTDSSHHNKRKKSKSDRKGRRHQSRTKTHKRKKKSKRRRSRSESSSSSSSSRSSSSSSSSHKDEKAQTMTPPSSNGYKYNGFPPVFNHNNDHHNAINHDHHHNARHGVDKNNHPASGVGSKRIRLEPRRGMETSCAPPEKVQLEPRSPAITLRSRSWSKRKPHGQAGRRPHGEVLEIKDDDAGTHTPSKAITPPPREQSGGGAGQAWNNALKDRIEKKRRENAERR